MNPRIYGDHIAVSGHISTWFEEQDGYVEKPGTKQKLALCGWETPSSSLAPHWTNGVWTPSLAPSGAQDRNTSQKTNKQKTVLDVHQAFLYFGMQFP